jgi:RNA polymerase sigma-70 factor, ECF subfamily
MAANDTTASVAAWRAVQRLPASDRLPDADLTARLGGLLERARDAWPDGVLPGAMLGRHLAERRPDDMSPGAYLDVVPVEDMALALLCAHGDETAIAAFERRHDGDLRMVYAKARGTKPAFDEYAQTLRTKLMTGDRPRLLNYAGIGDLKNWVRVTASRVLVDLQRSQPDKEVHDEAALAVPAPDDDPETQYLKRLYRDQMRHAFEAAVQTLAPAERNCLRDYYGRRLTIDELAAARGIHRATAARRVAKARASVMRATRQLLMQRTQLSSDELQSVVRLIESQLYVTVSRVFAADA